MTNLVQGMKLHNRELSSSSVQVCHSVCTWPIFACMFKLQSKLGNSSSLGVLLIHATCIFLWTPDLATKLQLKIAS